MNKIFALTATFFFLGAVAAEAQQRHRPNAQQGQGRCPQGMKAMGNLGCAGATITRAQAPQIAMHDVRIARGCVPGAKRTIWKDGTDANGKKTRWKIDQHAVCNTAK